MDFGSVQSSPCNIYLYDMLFSGKSRHGNTTKFKFYWPLSFIPAVVMGQPVLSLFHVCFPVIILVVLTCLSACSHSPSGHQHQTSSLASRDPDPETRAMIDSVRKAQADVDPVKVTVFMATQRALLARQRAEAASGLDKVNFLVMYGFEELKAGNTQTAIDVFRQVLRMVEPMQIPGKEQTVLEMKKLLALAALRLGEQENCILNHTSASCVIPIAKAGQHEKKEGSAMAMLLYEEILTLSPEDLTSLYLLNIAAMTLGQYPDGIPKAMRLPDGYFDSKISFPHFTDIAAELGFTSRGLAGGVAIEDFDRDGDLDIMNSEWGFRDQIRLWANTGKGGFEEITERTGLKGVTGGLNINHTDYNNDGYADVLILRGGWFRDQGKIPNSLLRNNGDGTFTDVTIASGMYSRCPTQNAAWADFDLDGDLDLFIGNESIPQAGPDYTFPSELYQNQGDGTFKEIAREAGLAVNAFVKGSAAGDINNDGFPDLYLSILQSDNQLFLNTSDENGIRFRNITKTAGVEEPFVSFPTWMFDFNNDGWLDIFVSAYSDGSEDLPGKVLRAYGKKDDPFRPRIYRNNGNLTFTEVSAQMGVTEPAFTMGSNYGDLDNDGFKDFYLGTGEPNLKSIVPNKMYWNRNGETFADITYAGGFGNIQKGHGVGFGDMDHDGDQDMYVVMGGSFEGDIYQDLFFENPIGQRNNWIVLQLEGVTANRLALGTKIEVTIEENGRERKICDMVATGSSFGGNSLQVEMGLGQATAIKEMKIYWPSKKQEPQSFRQVGMNKAYRLKEGKTPEQLEYKPVPFQLNKQHHH